MEREEFKKNRIGWCLVGVSGFLAVLFGAFGAHALAAQMDFKGVEIFRTAVSYQFYHTFAMAFCLWLAEKKDLHKIMRAFWFFLTGVVIFSGSLYAYVLSGEKFFAFLTPIGGLCFLMGWLLLILSHISCTKTSR